VKPFCVVLRLVPGLFYVKSLGTKGVPRFQVFLRVCAYGREGAQILLYPRVINIEHLEHMEQSLFSVTYGFHVFQGHRTRWNKINFQEDSRAESFFGTNHYFSGKLVCKNNSSQPADLLSETCLSRIVFQDP
jgi:hypothetical protein